MYQCQMPIL